MPRRHTLPIKESLIFRHPNVCKKNTEHTSEYTSNVQQIVFLVFCGFMLLVSDTGVLNDESKHCCDEEALHNLFREFWHGGFLSC